MFVLILACKIRSSSCYYGFCDFSPLSRAHNIAVTKISSGALTGRPSQGPHSQMPFAIIAMALPDHAGPDSHVRPQEGKRPDLGTVCLEFCPAVSIAAMT